MIEQKCPDCDNCLDMDYEPPRCTVCCYPEPHKWTGKQMGGSPDMAESTEWVGFCDKCGIEGPTD